MRLIGLPVLLVCTALCAQQDSKNHAGTDQDGVGLIELEANSHLVEGPIREGSYDDSFKIKRARYYVPDLVDCSNKIVDAAERWASSQNAKIVKSERDTGRVLVHLVKKEIPGFYELLYRVDLAKGTARVTFVQYREGVKTLPETDPQSGVEKLVPLLKEALTCVQPSSSH